MPDIDLGPNDYRKQDPKTGRWHLSSDPKLCRNMFFVSVAILIAVFVTRDQGGRDTLFGVTAMVAFGGGCLFAVWLKDVY